MMTSDFKENRRALKIWFVVVVWIILAFVFVGWGVEWYFQNREMKRAQQAQDRIAAFIQNDVRFDNVQCVTTTSNAVGISGSMDLKSDLPILLNHVESVFHELSLRHVSIGLETSKHEPVAADDFFVASFPRDLDAWRGWLAGDARD